MQIAVGQIVRAHGIRGEVLVAVRTDEPAARFAPGSVLPTEPPERGPLTVAAARWHSGRLIVAFEGVGDRTAAEGLRGTLLILDSAQITSLSDPDEFYDHELIGLGVVTAAGDPVGVVADVLHHGQDLLVVRREGAPGQVTPGQVTPGQVTPGQVTPGQVTPGQVTPGQVTPGQVTPGQVTWASRGRGAAEALVPFVSAIVTDVDLAAGRLVIDPPPGLLDPDEAIEA